MSTRLRSALIACASAIALAACPVLLGTGANAAPVSSSAADLPPAGKEVPSSMIARGSQLHYQGKTYTMDFEGALKQRIQADPDDAQRNVVRLQTVGFKVQADLEGGGTVVLAQNDIALHAESTLTLTQSSPPKYTERDVIPFTATLTLPGHEPVVLEGKEPMELTATLNQWPSRGDHYKLEKPVDLVQAGRPDNAVATLQTFPSQRGAHY